MKKITLKLHDEDNVRNEDTLVLELNEEAERTLTALVEEGDADRLLDHFAGMADWCGELEKSSEIRQFADSMETMGLPMVEILED